jgi:hypothetical protein
MHTPTPSTAVPTISMILRKDSMAVLIAGMRADFQCCFTWRKLARLAFEKDTCNGVMLCVAKGDQSRSYAASCSKLMRRPRKYEKGLTAFFFPNIDVAPAHCLADACAERFCNRFLSRETRSQMARREFHRHGIFDLAISKNAVKKAISKSVDGMLNARALYKIDTDAYYAHAKFAR